MSWWTFAGCGHPRAPVARTGRSSGGWGVGWSDQVGKGKIGRGPRAKSTFDRAARKSTPGGVKAEEPINNPRGTTAAGPHRHDVKTANGCRRPDGKCRRLFNASPALSNERPHVLANGRPIRGFVATLASLWVSLPSRGLWVRRRGYDPNRWRRPVGPWDLAWLDHSRRRHKPV